MRTFELFQKEIISLLFALLLAAIFHFFRARAKLVWGTPHGFTFVLPATSAPAAAPGGDGPQAPVPLPQNFNIHTGSIVVSNAGRDPATELEVTFNWRPDNYNIWPVRPYDTHTSPDNRFTLKFANLAPKEWFQVEMISPSELPLILNVRCKECAGKQIGVRPMRVYPTWMVAMFWGFVLLGWAAIIYLAIKLGALILPS
jgi:hypothetical protein